MKVIVINTDFGKTGLSTVKNYFKDHPEQEHLMTTNMRVIEMDVDTLMDFCRDPKAVVEDIYEWDPDAIFWDGVTGYQQGDLEKLVCGGSFNHESADWQDWNKVRKGTIFPMMNLIEQHNRETGKLWYKFLTVLEKETIDRRKSASASEKLKGEDIKSGSDKRGPMLDTTARDMAGAGFDLVVQTTKKTMGGKSIFKYKTEGADLMVKQRGWGLPAEIDADFAAIFRQYIAPKIGWVESKVVGEKV